MSVSTGDQIGVPPADSLSEWFSTRPGSIILEHEIAMARRLVSEIFGYHLLLIGNRDYVPVFGASRISWSSVMEPRDPCHRCAGHAATAGSVVRVDPDVLPVASDSVDVVVLPHVLEFSPRPHEALREVERILVGEGHLVLTGFNPWSLMGLWRAFLRQRGTMPWRGAFYAPARIKDWLALLGLDVLSTDVIFFRPPLGSEQLLERARFLDPVGRRLCPYLCGTYVIHARKRLTTLTPIRPRWVRRRQLVSVGLAEPSPRAAARERCR